MMTLLQVTIEILFIKTRFSEKVRKNLGNNFLINFAFLSSIYANMLSKTISCGLEGIKPTSNLVDKKS